MRPWQELRHTKWLILALAFAAAGSVSLGAGTPSTPEEIVEFLVAKGSVSSFVTEDVEKLYRIVRENPARFVGPITARLVLPADASARLKPERLEESLAAISVLQLVGRQHAEPPLIELYTKATRLSEEAALTEARAVDAGEDKSAVILKNRILGDYVVLRRAVLDLLGELGSSALIDAALCSLVEEDYSVQLVMLRYFSKIGAGHTELLERLTTLAQDAASPLKNEPALANALAALRAAPPQGA